MPSMDDDALLQHYRRELVKLRPLAEENQKVLDYCRGRAVSQKELDALLEDASRRGYQRAGLTSEGRGSNGRQG